MKILLIIFGIVIVLWLAYLFMICPRVIHKPDTSALLGVHYAHRGLFNNQSNAPENSLNAFRKAVESGYGIELDVQLSKDGEIVVIHDEKIDRTSNGKGLVRDYTMKQLRGFNYNRTKPEHFHADIPTLQEVLLYIRDKTNMTVNIELKTGVFFYPGIEEKTVGLVHAMGMEKRVIYSSFNHYSILHIKKLDPEAETGLLYSEGFVDVPAYAAKLGVDALHPSWRCLQYPNFLEDCRKHQIDLNVWTINREDLMRQMCRAGVNAIITNYPDKAARVRAEYEKQFAQV